MLNFNWEQPKDLPKQIHPELSSVNVDQCACREMSKLSNTTTVGVRRNCNPAVIGGRDHINIDLFGMPRCLGGWYCST